MFNFAQSHVAVSCCDSCFETTFEKSVTFILHEEMVDFDFWSKEAFEHGLCCCVSFALWLCCRYRIKCYCLYHKKSIHWIRIVTARVRSLTGRYCFHRCLSVNIGGGGYPIPSLGRGVPHPRSGWGVPHPRSRWEGGTPFQVWTGGTPTITGWSTPPPPSLGGVPPHTITGWGTPTHTGWGKPPPPNPIRQSSIAGTCYTAGGMPLAFTQEDFLVL